MSAFPREPPPSVPVPAAGKSRISRILAVGAAEQDRQLVAALCATSLTSAPANFVNAPVVATTGTRTREQGRGRKGGEVDGASGTPPEEPPRFLKDESNAWKCISQPKESSLLARRADADRLRVDMSEINPKDYMQTGHSGPREAQSKQTAQDILSREAAHIPGTGPPNKARMPVEETGGMQLQERNDRWRKGLPKASAHFTSYIESLEERAVRVGHDLDTDDVFEELLPYAQIGLEVDNDNAYKYETGWNLRMPVPRIGENEDQEDMVGDDGLAMTEQATANEIMDKIIARAQRLVAEEQYFVEAFDHEALDNLYKNLPEDSDTFDRDTFIASF